MDQNLADSNSEQQGGQAGADGIAQPAQTAAHGAAPGGGGAAPVSGIRPPPPLHVERGVISSKDWRTWKQMWTNYFVIAQLDRQTPAYQIALFLHTIGPAALEIYNTFADDCRGNLSSIITRFGTFAEGEANETFERYEFNTRKQQEDESFEAYLASLRTRMRSCNFCNCMKDSLLRDQIVLGVHDPNLKRRLLQERHLTLEKCTDICKSAEAAEAHFKAVGDHAEANVHTLGRENSSLRKQRLSRNTARQRQTPCKYCGGQHPRDKLKCPAFGKVCKSCGRRNHFEKVCMQAARAHSLAQEQGDSDTSTEYVDVINQVESGTRDDVFAQMLMGDTPVAFQVDSGASINILPRKHLNGTDYVLNPTKTKLMMWNKTMIASQAKCRLKLRNPKTAKKYSVEFVVVDEDYTPLLGSKASQKMGLITVNSSNFERVHSAREDNIAGGRPEGQHPEVFDDNLGELPGEVHLQVDPDVPPKVLPPRRLPHAIKGEVKSKLDHMTQQGIIAPVDSPTDWVSQLVVAKKKNGDFRLCIDPRPLNQALKREHYQLPTIEDILPDLNNARVFTKLDMSSAFWQIKLDEPSSLLTTFATPFGRYRWLRLPFGTNVSSEIFQRRLHQALEGLPGVICVADDILVYGNGETSADAIADHDAKLDRLLKRCVDNHIKLNKEKSVFRASDIHFLGHVVTSAGLQPDPRKVADVLGMPPPTDVEGVRRLIGFVTYLSKFLPSLSDTLEPIRELMKPDVAWAWASEHATALSKIKELVSKAPVLAYYNPAEELTVQCDASGTGLGASLLQNDHPIAYASRALTDTESRYASIEKEMLAVVFAMERFHQYTFGRFTRVISDHKPLEMIAKKPLVKAPKRLQGMLLRLQKYDYDITYQPGKLMFLADTLSRAVNNNPSAEHAFEEVNMMTHLPIRDERLQQIREQTASDDTLQSLKRVIIAGWPDVKEALPPQLMPYHSYRDELAVQDGLIFKGEHVIIPTSMRKTMKEKIHSSHLGIEGCLRRARESLFWPGMSSDIKQYIESCDICHTYEARQQRETLMSHDLPTRPWERVGTDLFTWNSKDYLVTVDYHSNFFEVDRLHDTSSHATIRKLKSHFARYGSPTQVISDNGPQFTSAAFREFAKEWDFEHLCSSPGNSRANGKAESAVKTAKRILTKSKDAHSDPYIAFLDHRNTPSQGLATSPAQRLMSRRTRTLLPTTSSLLEPSVVNERQRMKERVLKQAENYNKSAKDLAPLKDGDTVRMQPLVQGRKNWERAIVRRRFDERSYLIETPTGTYRRNRVHLRKTHEDPPAEMTADRDVRASPPSTPTVINVPHRSPRRDHDHGTGRHDKRTNDMNVTKTRSGRTVKRPPYLENYVSR